jgi:hypothetical protein
MRRDSNNRNKNPGGQSLHGGISNHQKPIWQWRGLLLIGQQPLLAVLALPVDVC